MDKELPPRDLDADLSVNHESLDESNEISLSELGLVETEGLSNAREAILSALTAGIEDDDPVLTAAWREYAAIVESVVEQIPSGVETQELYIRRQIAALVHKARLFREAGRRMRYLQVLDDASFYAYNMGLDEVCAQIDREIDAHL